MYAIFTNTWLSKRRAFGGATFISIEEAERSLTEKGVIVYFERDLEHDAADFFAADGEVYSVERIEEAQNGPHD